MEFICVNNIRPGRLSTDGDRYVNIIPGRKYTGEMYDSVHIIILDESGKECLYTLSNFEEISDVRNRKLDSII